MSDITAEFLFDFGSPNAYLVHRVLPALEARTGVTFKRVPVLLGGVFKATGNQPPMMAFGGIKNKMEYEQLEMQRFITKHKLEAFSFNPNFPVNTLMLMRGAIFAEQQGFLPEYMEAGMQLMWEEGKKMDDPEVFVAALTDKGLDGKALLDATQDPAVKAVLVDNTNNAVERGVFGIPSFFVNGDIWFGKDRLADVEEALITAK